MVTIKELNAMHACSDGVEWYKVNKKKTLLLTLDEAKTDSELNYFNWFVSKSLNKTNKIKYAIYAAEQVINIYESKYPNDSRPRKAIESAKNYLNDPSDTNKKSAAAAAADAAAADYAAADYAAAYAAAYAADAAAYAAYAADYAAAAYAAAAAAYAADAADAAAYAAAAYAAAAAAYAADAAKFKMKKSILIYGLELLKHQGVK